MCRIAKSGSMDISMGPASQAQEDDTMRTDQKGYKNVSGTRKDRTSKMFNGPPKDCSSAENNRTVESDEDKATLSFLIDYSLVAGGLRGKVTHRLTDIQEEFSGRGEEKIMSFMARYLSKLEKSIEKQAVEKEQQRGEVRITQPSEPHKPTLEVVPEGSAHPSDTLQQGKSFQIRWTFKPPSPSGITGERLHYKIVVCGKNLERGEHIQIAEGGGEIDFTRALTALTSSEPLPSGTYFIEADAEFSLKSVKSHRQSACSARRFIKVA